MNAFAFLRPDCRASSLVLNLSIFCCVAYHDFLSNTVLGNIPEYLWAKAIELARQHGFWPTARAPENVEVGARTLGTATHLTGNDNVISGPSRKMKVKLHMVPITIHVRLRSICFAGSLLSRHSRIIPGNRIRGKVGPKPFSAAVRTNHRPLGLNKPANPATTPAVT